MTESPYTPPTAQPEAEMVGSSRKIALLGVMCLAIPVVGKIGSLISLMRAFAVLEKGNSDPGELASEISASLLFVLYTVPVGFIGVVLVSIALLKNQNRETWFLRSVCVLSLTWCFLIYPVGIFVAIYLLIMFLKRKSEFSSRTTIEPIKK